MKKVRKEHPQTHHQATDPVTMNLVEEHFAQNADIANDDKLVKHVEHHRGSRDIPHHPRQEPERKRLREQPAWLNMKPRVGASISTDESIRMHPTTAFIEEHPMDASIESKLESHEDEKHGEHPHRHLLHTDEPSLTAPMTALWVEESVLTDTRSKQQAGSEPEEEPVKAKENWRKGGSIVYDKVTWC